ncbi:MAG: Re/Si-specific NAD(P)(+) transhydrogenase subunit alpha [Flavobacteriales bacterium]
MKVVVLKETKDKETRVSVTPGVIKTLIKKEFECSIESGAGLASSYTDEEYKEAGSEVVNERDTLLGEADVVLMINPPGVEDVKKMKKGAVLLSFMFAQSNKELVEACKAQGISSFSMDFIPRISRAQKMDALSSQANLAGYKTVMLAANASDKIFPLLMTAAGTVKPSSAVIFGAGVAGLQALATANRLGAKVEVSDIRHETKEQVESLGGKFIEVEDEGDVATEGGYVKEVSEEFLKKQKEVVKQRVQNADVVITTAQIPGKKAPVLVTEDMMKGMKRGAVIVDMATEQGGNCEWSEYDKVVEKEGLKIIGTSNLPGALPINASELYAKNISEFLMHLAGKDGFHWDMEDQIKIIVPLMERMKQIKKKHNLKNK